jgi:hypothetical protein
VRTYASFGRFDPPDLTGETEYFDKHSKTQLSTLAHVLRETRPSIPTSVGVRLACSVAVQFELPTLSELDFCLCRKTCGLVSVNVSYGHLDTDVPSSPEDLRSYHVRS